MRLALVDWRSGKNGEMRASEDVSGPSRGDWEGRVEGGDLGLSSHLLLKLLHKKLYRNFARQ